jgi:indolepyruvate ferredoxin oxidoreductase
MSKVAAEHTRAVVNTRVAPTSAFASNPDLDLKADDMIAAIAAATGEERSAFVDAGSLAYALLGNEIAANLFLIGYAIQKGWMPIGIDALDRALELNGVGLDMNRAALAWGRLAAGDIAAVDRFAGGDRSERTSRPETLDELIARFESELTAYQNAAYAARWRELVDAAATADRRFPGHGGALTRAVACDHYKLMAYKDEYEVGRLFSDGSFMEALRQEFEGDIKLEFHMAPPLLQKRDPKTGRYRKRKFGKGTMLLYRTLARLKGLRGTRFDIFGYSAHRKVERALIDEYAQVIRDVLGRVDETNYELAVEIANWPDGIRGYDVVKDEHLGRARARLDELLLSYFDPASEKAALEPAE